MPGVCDSDNTQGVPLAGRTFGVEPKAGRMFGGPLRSGLPASRRVITLYASGWALSLSSPVPLTLHNPLPVYSI